MVIVARSQAARRTGSSGILLRERVQGSSWRMASARTCEALVSMRRTRSFRVRWVSGSGAGGGDQAGDEPARLGQGQASDPGGEVAGGWEALSGRWCRW